MSEIEQRRRKVDVGDVLGSDRSLGKTGAPNHKWNADSRIIRVVLAGADPVLTVEKPVVGSEHDDGALQLAGGTERPHDPIYGIVHRQKGLELRAIPCRDIGHILVREPAEDRDHVEERWLPR